jgi:hypothetical protein
MNNWTNKEQRCMSYSAAAQISHEMYSGLSAIELCLSLTDWGFGEGSAPQSHSGIQG